MQLGITESIAVTLILASVLALIAKRVKQPLLIAYVAAGIIAGPHILGIVKGQEQISMLSGLGLVFLLFVIGLELDAKKIRAAGIKVVAIGILQVALTFLLGFVPSYLFGFGLKASMYLGLAAAFSSTMVAAKLLRDSGEISSLHGSIAIGLLVVQDIIAVLAISASMLIAAPGAAWLLLLKGIAIAAAALLMYKYAMPWLVKEISASGELLFAGSLAIMFMLALLSSSLGYSPAIGAFIAGIMLGTTYFSSGIASKFKPLSDFFLILFFIVIGMQFSPSGLKGSIALIAALSAVMLLAKPALLYLLSRLFGFSRRTSFFSSFKLGQGSEFSIILAAQGVAALHLRQEAVSAVIASVILTMVASTYISKYDGRLYRLFRKVAGKSAEEKLQSSPLPVDSIIFGITDISMRIAKEFLKEGRLFIIIENNPDKVRGALKQGVPVVYGDMSDNELYGRLDIKKARLIVSTVHHLKANLVMAEEVRRRNKSAIVMAMASSEEDAIRLYREKADFVVMPRALGAEKVLNYLHHLDFRGIRMWGRRYYRQLRRM